MNIHGQSLLLRNADIVFSEIDGETVMMDTNFENYFGMDSLGSRIWQLLGEEISVQKLSECLSREYDVSPERCQEDLNGFLQSLIDQNMLSIR